MAKQFNKKQFIYFYIDSRLLGAGCWATGWSLLVTGVCLLNDSSWAAGQETMMRIGHIT